MPPKAFIKYDVNDLLTSGVLIVNNERPAGNGWIQVPATLCCSTVPFPDFGTTTFKKKGFIKYSSSGEIVAGSTIIRNKRPKDGNWRQVPYKRCC